MNQAVFFIAVVCAVFGVAVATIVVGAITDRRREREMERRCNKHALFLYVTRIARAQTETACTVGEMKAELETLKDFVFKHRAAIVVDKDGKATLRKFADRPTLEECRDMGFDAACAEAAKGMGGK